MVKLKEFNAVSYVDALAECEKAGHRALYMPDVARARIAGDAPWDKFLDSRSVRVTGRTKQGDGMVLYVHCAHLLSTASGLGDALSKGLVNGAACFPQDSFLELLERDDERADDGTYVVKAVPHKVLMGASKGVIPVERALKHPQTIPFLGSKEVAEQYLQAFERQVGSNIGIWFYDDLRDEGPLARPLCVGNYYYYGLNGNDNYYNVGRLVGVRASESEQRAAGAQKISEAPSLETATETMYNALLHRKMTEPITREWVKGELAKIYPSK